MKQRVIAGLVYATSALCPLEFLDFLSGAEPSPHPMTAWARTFVVSTFTAAVLFAIGCVLLFLTLRWATICSLFASVLSLPFIFGAATTLRSENFTWAVLYRPETVTAVVTSIVSCIYSINSLRLSRRNDNDAVERGMNWKLFAAGCYFATMLFAANWRSIADWLFKLRYGS